jgi:hypothetical protein
MRGIRLIAGVLLLLMGLLWAAQGAGLILWPASSFMLQQGQWIWIGGVVALAGLALLLTARRH